MFSPAWIVFGGIGRVRIASSTHHPDFPFACPVREEEDGIAVLLRRMEVIVSGASRARRVGFVIVKVDVNLKRRVTVVRGLRSEEGIVQGCRQAMPFRGSLSCERMILSIRRTSVGEEKVSSGDVLSLYDA